MSKYRNNPEVFFVIGSLRVGGAEIHLSVVSQELVKRGYKITVYNLSGYDVLGNTMSNTGVKIINPPINFKSGKLKFLNPVILGLSSLKLFLIFLFKRPSIVHFFLPHAYIIGAIMARCAGLSHLVMSRRSMNDYQDWLLKLFEYRLHASMAAIIGNSKAVVSQLHQDEKVPQEKLGLIYNGIDSERFDAPFDSEQKKTHLDIAPGTIILIIVATLIPYKGHSDLLKALAEIQGEMPDDWILLVVGGDDGIGDSLKRQAAAQGLKENVRFLGIRRDIPDLLRVSDLAVLCSHEEGFSNAILEGMAAKLPMVVTDVGGNAEAVEDGVTGIVVPAHSLSALGAAILKLVNDAQLRKRMGHEARKRVQSEFSLEACVAQYETLYESIRPGTN